MSRGSISASISAGSTDSAPRVSCSPSCCSTTSPCRPGCRACSRCCAGRPPPKGTIIANASGCSARSSNPPTMPSFSMTLDGTITAWNRAAERLSGFTAAEAVGNRIDIVIPPELRDQPREMLERIAQGEAIEQHDTVRLRKDGSRLDISLVISPIRSRTGEVVGASAIARDIGERKRAQQALNQQIEERRRIFETSQDLILVTDTKGNFVQVSPSSMTILGYQPSEMIGHTRDRIHPSRRSRQHAQRDAVGAARSANAQLRDPLYPQGRAGGDADLDGNVVGAGAATFLRRPRPDGKAGRGSAVSARPRRWKPSAS